MNVRQVTEIGVMVVGGALLTATVGSLYSVPTVLIITVILALVGCGVAWGDGTVTSRKVIAAGVALADVTLVVGWFTHPLLTVLLGTALTVIIGAGGVWRYRNAHSATLIGRWKARAEKDEGVANFRTILRTSSWWAMKRKATILRPSLAKLSRWARWRTPVTEYATRLVKVGCLWVYSPCEDVTVRVGGARSGKTQEVLCHILDAPGAVVATSTKVELVTNTVWRRRRKGPVYIFNPSGLGGIPSTITFSPLSGCADAEVAIDRATDLLAASGRVSKDDSDFWMTAARMTLAALLRAAALRDKGTMWDVRAWLSNPEKAAPEVMSLLGQASGALYADAHQFFTDGNARRDSVRAIISQTLFWLNIPGAAEAAHNGDFDVEKLLDEKGTVYLLGAANATLAPLMTALTGHISREGRRLAALQPGGRLDPPLTIVPDEAYRICPLPLDEWVADMGSHGITLHICTQSRSQLCQRWGEYGAAAILDNAASLMIFGGTRDPIALAGYQALVPTLSRDLIAQLPAGYVAVIRRNQPPVVGKPPVAWRRHRRYRYRRIALLPFTALAAVWSACRARLAPVPAPVSRRAVLALPAGRTASAAPSSGSVVSRPAVSGVDDTAVL